MSVNDPIADMLTRIRNAVAVRHDSVEVPLSKTKAAIARILKEEGYIRDYEIVGSGPHAVIRIHLAYVGRHEPVVSGLRRVSKPGLRVYVQRREIPRVYGGLGIAILSTSQGIMTGKQAWQKQLGGELLCYVW